MYLYARPNAMMEKMNDQLMHFPSEMRECGPLHEIDPILLFPRLESSLYDDCESSLPPEFNVVDGTPSTSVPIVALSFSSTTMDTSVSDLTLLPSPLPLAQCIRLYKFKT